MNREHVLVIDGRERKPLLLNRGRLLSTQSLYEFSTIIWVIDSLVDELAAYSTLHQGALEQALMQRTMLMRDWVQDGHSLIIVGPSAVPVFRVNPNGTTTGAHVNQLFPLGIIHTTLTEGKKLQLARETPASALIEPYLKKMSYRATLSSTDLVPLIFAQRATAGEKFAVGGYLDEGKGKVFFIPNCDVSNDKTDEFYRVLAELPESAKARVEELPLMGWTGCFPRGDSLQRLPHSTRRSSL